jgi:hypothetical protein
VNVPPQIRYKCSDASEEISPEELWRGRGLRVRERSTDREFTESWKPSRRSLPRVRSGARTMRLVRFSLTSWVSSASPAEQRCERLGNVENLGPKASEDRGRRRYRADWEGVEQGRWRADSLWRVCMSKQPKLPIWCQFCKSCQLENQ